jgi:hypothetical protein
MTGPRGPSTAGYFIFVLKHDDKVQGGGVVLLDGGRLWCKFSPRWSDDYSLTVNGVTFRLSSDDLQGLVLFRPDGKLETVDYVDQDAGEIMYILDWKADWRELPPELWKAATRMTWPGRPV